MSRGASDYVFKDTSDDGFSQMNKKFVTVLRLLPSCSHIDLPRHK